MTISRVLITGSTQGVGRATAEALLRAGHHVIVHARTQERLAAVRDLQERGAEAIVGDVGSREELEDLAGQVADLGHLDAVIHNAGTMDGPLVLPVNVVAPYVLTAGIPRPGRLIYLSSSMHRGGSPTLEGADWSGARRTRSYSDSKLHVTTLMAAVARLWPDTIAHAVDPGWVPTRMGGAGASDDLALAHPTQVRLATSEEPEALTSGGYWFHQRTQAPHPSVHDEALQDGLLEALAHHTGISLALGR